MSIVIHLMKLIFTYIKKVNCFPLPVKAKVLCQRIVTYTNLLVKLLMMYYKLRVSAYFARAIDLKNKVLMQCFIAINFTLSVS